jgi:hypothetical protein
MLSIGSTPPAITVKAAAAEQQNQHNNDQQQIHSILQKKIIVGTVACRWVGPNDDASLGIYLIESGFRSG